MADDQQNPFTMLGMMQMMQPNKYIDPAYKDKSLPMPGFYTGVAGNTPPTDASGKPIQDFVDYNNIAQGQYQKQLTDYNSQPKQAPGTTLNSTPQDAGMYGAPSASELATMYPGTNATPQQIQAGQQARAANQARINPGPSAYYAPGNSGFGSNQYANGRAPMVPFAQDTGAVPQQAAAPAAGAAPPSPPDLRQAYLNALSNPGPVTTPGATVAQSAPLGQPSVLDSFLSANKAGPAAPAGGGYSNAGFFNTLNKLRSS